MAQHDTPITRRGLLVKLGLAAGAAYIAPTLAGLDVASASTPSRPKNRPKPKTKTNPRASKPSRPKANPRPKVKVSKPSRPKANPRPKPKVTPKAGKPSRPGGWNGTMISR